jgi:hypothetical protein
MGDPTERATTPEQTGAPRGRSPDRSGALSSRSPGSVGIPGRMRGRTPDHRPTVKRQRRCRCYTRANNDPGRGGPVGPGWLRRGCVMSCAAQCAAPERNADSLPALQPRAKIHRSTPSGPAG